MNMRAIAFALATTLCVATGCTGPTAGPTGPAAMGPTGVPNPPFEGEKPDEPFIFEGEPGTYGGMLVIPTAQDPKSFNGLLAGETSTTGITNGPMYTTLLGFDNVEQKIDNGLCTSIVHSDDNLVWTFTLRKGVRWSDGAPFTAHDVKFNYDVAFDEKIDSSMKSAFMQTDKTLPKVEVIDDHTFRFTLTEPNAIFLDNVGSTYLVPKHKWEESYKKGEFAERALTIDTKPEDVVGLGPFRLKEFASEQRVVLERNPYYWKVDKKGQRLPYLDRVIFRIVPDMNTMLTVFQNGEVDMHWNVRPEEFGLLKRDEQARDYTVHELGPGYNVLYIMVNQNPNKDKTGKHYVDPVLGEWFRNVKFRKAIAHAIDRQAIINTSYQGLGTPVSTFCPPANKVWYDKEASIEYDYSVEKAKALLKEIGLEDRDGDGIAEDSSGHKCAFRLVTNSNNSSRVGAATVIKDNLRAVGIDVNFQGIPFNSMVEALQNTFDWAAVIGGWQSGNPPDPVLMKNIVTTSGMLFYSYPLQKTPATEWGKQIDDLMSANARTLDLAERKRQFAQVQRLWSDNLPEIDLLVPNYFVAVKNKVGNLRPSSLPLFTYWNIEELYLKK
ncbi:MAG: ABC transporter substrate-binding protein [Blastocatellia bacterium]|nr:ABC transporter substrate-binding protein [Blastocatellia bacterium]